MAKYIRYSFAVNGDRVAVNDETQSSGLLSYQQGYGAQYSADIQSDPTARRINRDRFNQVMNDITDNIKEWQEQLYPDYVDPSSNGGTALEYSQGMIVNNNGIYRISLVNNNAQVPTGSNWADAFPLPIALGGTGAENASGARINLGINAASESVAGLARIATESEANSGTNDQTIMTPSKVFGTPVVASAWVNFNGTGVISIRDSYNVSGITDLGTGSYEVTFETSLANVNYSVAGMGSDNSNTITTLYEDSSATRTVSRVRVRTSNTTLGSPFDCDRVSVVVFGGQS